MGLFRLLARVTIGLLFAGHGTQKLFGWFGGGGVEGTGSNFEKMGLVPGRRHALAAGVSETAGGLLFAAGAATPAAAAAVSGSMITAIKTATWQKGLWIQKGGYEYNLVLLAAVFGLTENGPGRWSVDRAWLGRDRWGTFWAFAALLAGAGGSAAALAAAQHEAASHDEADEPWVPAPEPAVPAIT
jgi:putative oxidoreductase